MPNLSRLVAPSPAHLVFFPLLLNLSSSHQILLLRHERASVVRQFKGKVVVDCKAGVEARAREGVCDRCWCVRIRLEPLIWKDTEKDYTKCRSPELGNI